MSKSFFTKNARQWDELRACMFSDRVREIILNHAALHPESIVADIGAGTGFNALGAGPHVAKMHLVDNSPEMLAVAKRNLAGFSNVEYHLADGSNIPLPSGSVDAVLANMYLHHAPDPLAAIQEMARLLKPGGKLVITDMDQHTHVWLQDEQDDIWLGFDRDQVYQWMKSADLVNVLVADTNESCCADAKTIYNTASVTIFVAAGTKPQPDMQQAVQTYYRKIAVGETGCCSPTAKSCNSSAEANVIPIEEIQAASYAVDEGTLSLGCGFPIALADLQLGEVVLDIGSGAGADIFPAAKLVGKQGKVIGLDVLEEMLVKARNRARSHGYTNIEFRQGDAQAIPLEDTSVDVVMSNCVINLVQDKGQAFREAYRVLRPGGRLALSDIVADRPFSPILRQDTASWSACVSGALRESEYLALISSAGFTDIETTRSQSWSAEDGTHVYSINVLARKPSQ